MAQQEVHISSLVVHVKPDQLEATKALIQGLENTEIHGDSPDGKIVVVLETANQGFVTDTIEVINAFPNVLTTFLVYHQIEQFDSETEDFA
ncbi:chaperone NapD [uncultured Ferrimonas sp.]|uniref:chaperone NapD n=1 Tax=uncultured Ferrimonas sp. TaxID=432640 RepID=UPI00260ED368|nr:chaperone NapD [uncultured Ferrimonas sp.]